MSISFDRNRTQVSFERFIGLASTEELLTKKADFKSHCLSSAEVTQLHSDLMYDAVDFFYSGILFQKELTLFFTSVFLGLL